MPSNYQKDAKKVQDAFLEKMFRYEANENRLLAQKWQGVSSHLDGLIQDLANKEFLSKDQLFKSELYKKFLRESKVQTELFNNYAMGLVIDRETLYAKYGLASSQEMIGLVRTNFNRLGFDAVKNFVAVSSKGSPLEKLFAKSYPMVVDKLTQTLTNSIALGYGADKTARLLAENMNGNLTRARVISRTESMNVFRQTSIQQMKDSGVVKGWTRIEQDDAPDDFCQEQNGTNHSFDEPFDSHPNCRGTSIPWI